MPAPTEVAQDLPTRLRAAATAVSDAKTAYDLRVRQRDQLVREAIDDHGMSQIAVAQLAGVVKGRISAILAKPDDDDQ
jgi:predicted XRE-type DNA-binding protein